MQSHNDGAEPLTQRSRLSKHMPSQFVPVSDAENMTDQLRRDAARYFGKSRCFEARTLQRAGALALDGLQNVGFL